LISRNTTHRYSLELIQIESSFAHSFGPAAVDMCTQEIDVVVISCKCYLSCKHSRRNKPTYNTKHTSLQWELNIPGIQLHECSFTDAHVISYLVVKSSWIVITKVVTWTKKIVKSSSFHRQRICNTVFVMSKVNKEVQCTKATN